MPNAEIINSTPPEDQEGIECYLGGKWDPTALIHPPLTKEKFSAEDVENIGRAALAVCNANCLRTRECLAKRDVAYFYTLLWRRVGPHLEKSKHLESEQAKQISSQKG